MQTIYVNTMLTLNNELEKDILAVLLHVPNARLQRKQIRDQLSSRYAKKYAKGSFDVVLQRRLDHLGRLGVLKVEYVERSAFYFIVDKMKDEVKLLLEKEDFKTEIDQMAPQFFQELKKFLDFLVESEEGEEFWLWLPDIDHPEKIKKFRNVGTKILRQD